MHADAVRYTSNDVEAKTGLMGLNQGCDYRIMEIKDILGRI